MDFIGGLDLAKPMRITMSPIRSKRSDAQNRLLWMWNNEIQRHLAEHYGQHASAEEWHNILVNKLCPTVLHTVKLPDGTQYKAGRSRTSKFNADQMTEYLSKLDAYCADSLGLLLTHPSDLINAIYGERRPA